MQKKYNVYNNLGYWFLLLILLVFGGFYTSYFSVFFQPAVGIHGQVIYINRSANMVVAYFSSQPDASSVVGYKPFVSKLNACRNLAKKMCK